MYDKLVAKVNSIDTSGFVLKTNYDTDKTELENKILDTSWLVKKTDDNAKITEIEGKIPSISGLATNAALTAVENKVPITSSLVTKTDYETKITDIEKKRLTDHDHDAKLRSLNQKINLNKTKHLLVENELKKLKTFDLSYFKGKSHFERRWYTKLFSIQPMDRYFKLILNKKYISEGKSKGLSDESIKSPTTSDNSLSPLIDYLGNKIRLKFNGSCLKQHKLTYTHQKLVNIYIFYEIIVSSSNNNGPTLRNSLFGAVRLTKDADIDRYRYSGYGIGFDRTGTFSFSGGGFGSNVIIFDVDMS